MEESNDRLERLQDDLEGCRNELRTWTDSLEELSEIEDAFRTNGKFDFDGRTILDVGTDCVKPLYIALKFNPDRIIGINENLDGYSFGSDVAQKSKLLTQTAIGFYGCSLFDEERLSEICRKEKIDCFDFILLSKTLHHLRTGECVEEHECPEDENSCKYGFEEGEIFEKLLDLGKRVIVNEWFFPQDEDDDKVRGRGGYFTTKEWKRILGHLSDKYKVTFIRPRRFNLDKKAMGRVSMILRRMDVVCFYVER